MSSSPAKTPVYLRGLPPDIVRGAQAAAARRGVTLAGFVAETLARAVRQREPKAQSTADMTADMRWYEKNRGRVAREYPGEYVAIIGRRVVDHDASFEALAERVFAREGARNIFMPLVGAPKRPMKVPSPHHSRQR